MNGKILISFSKPGIITFLIIRKVDRIEKKDFETLKKTFLLAKKFIFSFLNKLYRSDTESAEDTTATKDDAKPEEEAKKDDKKAAGPTVVARMSNLFAAVKKSVKKPKENKYTAETPESEMKVIIK